MRHLGFATVLFLATASCADYWAPETEEYYCAVDDKNLTLVAKGEMMFGFPRQILRSEGHVQIKANRAGIASRKLDIGDALVHHWRYRREFDLHYFVEPSADFPSGLDLALETDFSDHRMDYHGRYMFRAAAGGSTVDVTGPITCKVD